MENREIARVLDEVADMLDIKGEKYKPRAYRRAAQTVRTHSDSVADMSKDELKELPGIGEQISRKIRELAENGSMGYHQHLKDSLPFDFEALLSVEGIGPKTVKLLHEELGVGTLEDLEIAARNRRIRDLKGMGEKTEQNILENLQFAKKDTGRKPLGFVLPLADKLKVKLADSDLVERIAVAGSLRRMKATIGDIDILIVSPKPANVMEKFVKLKEVEKVIAQGDTKSTVRLFDGLDCDLRVVSDKSFGSALLYFTGSRDTNIRMRKIAAGKGYKLNEYGLFDGKKRIAGGTEDEVFGRLGMTPIPPEIRENRGEVDASLEDDLPDLVPYGSLRGDLHVHTTWSDGRSSLQDMVKAAEKAGYEYLAITDHAADSGVAGMMGARKLQNQITKVHKLNEETGLHLLSGAEVNITSEGGLSIPEDICEGLDVVVASIHFGLRQDKGQLTDRMVSAMETGLVDIIGHPTGRMTGQREGYDLEWDRLFDAASETGTALEVNSHPLRLDLRDVRVRAAIEAGCRIAVNTDAHHTSQLAYARFGVGTARRGWAEAQDVINALPLKDLKSFLD